ncbi:MAG TPA: GGDEF domain-containing protein [Solirubrobacteraceae bacterium]
MLTSLLRQQIKDTCRRRASLKGVVAVLLVDLDDFKLVNDTFGRAAGDDVLRTVARRLRACLSESDTAARLDGDEFVLVLDGDWTADAALEAAAPRPRQRHPREHRRGQDRLRRSGRAHRGRARRTRFRRPDAHPGGGAASVCQAMPRCADHDARNGLGGLALRAPVQGTRRSRHRPAAG